MFVPEAYSFDAVSQLGFVAARTDAARSPPGSCSIYTRTPTLTAMTAAGLDYVSGGRFTLGIGASGPQVIEGFHGVPLRRAAGPHPGDHRDLPAGLAPREGRAPGQALHDPAARRAGHRAGQAAQADQPPGARANPDHDRRDRPEERRAGRRDRRRLAADLLPARDGRRGLGRLAGGRARQARRRRWARSTSCRRPLRIGTDAARQLLDGVRASSRSTSAAWARAGKNFYNDLAGRYGYEDEAEDPGPLPRRQEGGGRGGRAGGAAAGHSLIGPGPTSRERIAAFAEAGVTTLELRPAHRHPSRAGGADGCGEGARRRPVTGRITPADPQAPVPRSRRIEEARGCGRSRAWTELRAAVGEDLGTSAWFTVEQPRIDGFADATEDHQWIHVDPDARREGPVRHDRRARLPHRCRSCRAWCRALRAWRTSAWASTTG